MIAAVARRLRRRLALTLLALCLPIVCLAATITNFGEIDGRTRDTSLDIFTSIRPFVGDEELARSMVFVDIDEASLARFGQWPWPRQYMAVLMQNIGLSEPLAIGVDILMSEDDRFNADAIERLGGFETGSLAGQIPDGDALLGEMLSYTPSVVAVSLTPAESANEPYLPASVSVIGDSLLPVMEADGLLSPVPKVAQAPGAGFVSLAFERDSIVRKIPMVARFGDQLIPSLSAEMLRVAQGAGGHILKQAADTGSGANLMRTGQVTMTLDGYGRLPIYHGTIDRFTTVSAADILDETGLERLTNAFVIIGSSATGLKDTHSTNLEAAIPGPMIHLSAIHQLLSGMNLKTSALYSFGEILGAVLIAMAIGLLAAHAPIGIGLAALAAGVAATAFGGFWMFTNLMYLSNAILAAGIVLFCGATSLVLRGIVDELARRQLRSAFGQYLSPQMVKTIETSGAAPELGGVTTDISVMFMDVRGFTTLSESLAASPQVLTRLINIILDEASEVIMAHQGTLDKFIGDCVMAFWNAPLAQSDHHDRAVAAAIALQQHVPAINARLAEEIGDDWDGSGIAIGVGVASGTVVVGNFGSRTRLSYSVVGDTVNLAARLEPFSKQTGLPLTFANATAQGASSHSLLKIDEITVRGRANAEPIYSWQPLSPEAQAAHDRLLELILEKTAARRRKSLQTSLDQLAGMDGYPQGLVDYYRRRIEAL